MARRYEPGTNVIETTWATESGWVIVRDALLVDGVESHSGRERLVAKKMLARWAHCPEGHAEIELVCDAFPDYGQSRVEWDLDSELGVATAMVGDMPLRLQADMDLELRDGRIWGVRRLGTDENAFCALTWSDEAKLPGHAGEAARHIYETGQAWRRWLARGKFPDHRWRNELQRSALTLKGLMYAPTGRHGRGADHLAARDARGRAQLGLPLHLDPRRDLHAVGPPRARPRRRGDRLHVVRRERLRGTRTSRSCTGSAARRS